MKSFLAPPAADRPQRRSPLQSIASHCRWCMGGSPEDCPATACALYTMRNGRMPESGKRSPLAAIKSYCLACVGSHAEVRDCQGHSPYLSQPACSLWPFRAGVNPNIGKEKRERLSAIARKRGLGKAERAKTGLESREAPLLLVGAIEAK